MIAELIVCASLIAVDGDTVKCDGQNMRLLGEGVPFVSGIDTPEIGSHAKCIKERKLALIAKGRLKELLAEKGLRVMFSGAVDRTPSHRPLVNIYRANGEEIGKKLLAEGFARTWSPRHRNDWCS
ncbi:thermonuclease family protein [Rhizobium phaseoli]|uniref:thermonuclease family protein n=1 Tax=Rhizobium phaseoli TaxID=396 RepID=UPI0007EC0B63|nr:thermonuclease family protein [Rhizobium phaseoli]ANL52878.1 nuclease SNase-like protein [Rhizobium phaseoli]